MTDEKFFIVFVDYSYDGIEAYEFDHIRSNKQCEGTPNEFFELYIYDKNDYQRSYFGSCKEMFIYEITENEGTLKNKIKITDFIEKHKLHDFELPDYLFF